MPFLSKNEKKIAQKMLEKGYGYVLFSEDAAPLYTPTAEMASEQYRESEAAEFNFLPRIMKIEDFLAGKPIPPMVLKYERRGPGKFNGNLAEWLYAMWSEGRADDELGDMYFNAYGLFIFDESVIVKQRGAADWEFQGAIIEENNQGFVDVTTYDTAKEAREVWNKLEGDYEEFLAEAEEEEGEENPLWKHPADRWGEGSDHQTVMARRGLMDMSGIRQKMAGNVSKLSWDKLMSKYPEIAYAIAGYLEHRGHIPFDWDK